MRHARGRRYLAIIALALPVGLAASCATKSASRPEPEPAYDWSGLGQRDAFARYATPKPRRHVPSPRRVEIEIGDAPARRAPPGDDLEEDVKLDAVDDDEGSDGPAPPFFLDED